MVLTASGRETRGQGTARATVAGALTGQDGGTAGWVRTDLAVTGRPAQFGRGVTAEVGDRRVGQFARCLAERLGEPERVPGRLGGRGDAPDPVRPTRELDDEPLDLLRATGVPKRAAAALVAVAVVVIATTRIRRMRNRRV
ncbi:hypothetical protein QFZ22_001630 [Streptomyces canus]|uniref:Carbon monoxide dehydrogenase subunit G n=1 Tax=Streptomyces canus TaxID=58343 RepID=A0AAW8F917_9ACTN|nr:hypothetical protein [Streptomyces canus]MDQ0905645.1 hypothetical protein [Streptomyces canus]